METGSTQIEMADDNDIETVEERQDLLSKSKKMVKSKNMRTTCCKAFLITIAIIIFVAMLIQIWSDYHEFLTTHSLPPSIHSMSSHCEQGKEDSCMTKSYNAPSCMWSNVTEDGKLKEKNLICDTAKPTHHMVNTNKDHLVKGMTWEDKLNVTFWAGFSGCVHLTIWSI